MATFVIFGRSILYLIIAYPRAIRNRLFMSTNLLASFRNALLDLARRKGGSSASIRSSRSPQIAPVIASVRARPQKSSREAPKHMFVAPPGKGT